MDNFLLLYLTIVLAIYGAILSTYNLIIKIRETTRQIHIEISKGYLASGNLSSPQLLFVIASNTGSRTITLSCGGILLPNDEKLVLMQPNSDVSFPYELGEGKNCKVWIEGKSLAVKLKKEGLRRHIKLYGFYTDAIGKTYKSKSIKFNLDSWSNAAE